MTAPNHFQINRSLLSHPLWLAAPFTKGQAWVDMIGLAAHAKYHVYIRGVRVDLERGQLALSEREFAVRWKWSRGKVRRFLSEMESKTVQQIVQQKNNVTSVVTIVNYNHYQLHGTADGTTDDTTSSTTDDTTSSTTDGPQTDPYKKNREGKEDKEGEQERAQAMPPAQEYEEAEEGWELSRYLQAFQNLGPAFATTNDQAVYTCLKKQPDKRLRAQAFCDFCNSVLGMTEPPTSTTGMLAGYMRRAADHKPVEKLEIPAYDPDDKDRW